MHSTPNSSLVGPTPEQRPHASGQPDAELLQAVLDRAGIDRNWALVIVGDGSGCRWDHAAGWASVLIDKATRGRRLFYGAVNAGSINRAEIMPYDYALDWYDHNGGRQALKQTGFLNVHILTDSQIIAEWGNRASGDMQLPRKHAVQLAGLRELRKIGYVLKFHWARRSTTLLNWTADLIAGLARRELQRAGLHPTGDETLSQRAAYALSQVRFEDPRTGDPISLYHLNHDE